MSTRQTVTDLNCSNSIRSLGSLPILRSHCRNCALLHGPWVSSCSHVQAAVSP